ncbi:MAG TPA: flavin reductase family protein, partial [Bacteroidia bacterium]|nr:flavin reductase family protein [Bacteroidia bacterium]
QIPSHIRNSDILSGNDLGQLGNIEALPTVNEINEFSEMEEIKKLKEVLNSNPTNAAFALHLAAKELIKAKKIEDAWKLLLMKN